MIEAFPVFFNKLYFWRFKVFLKLEKAQGKIQSSISKPLQKAPKVS
jgi:hypothetical protein